LLFGSIEREITDVELLHLRTPSVRNLNNAIAERTVKPRPPEGRAEACHGERGGISGRVNGLEN